MIGRGAFRLLAVGGLGLALSLGAAAGVGATGHRAAAKHETPAAHQASTAPTLGVKRRFTEGFGKVRPKIVDYGGDGQSLVVDVTWSSWGRARAVGHGQASWVWPGWCSACGSVNLRATVVAFDRGTCQGHPVYDQVEWYFPSRGMYFSQRLSYTNLCTWKLLSTGNLTKPRSCEAVALPSSSGAQAGEAEKIQVYDSRLSCKSIRSFLRVSQVMSHYDQDARFHSHGWWCGSELSMQLKTPPPQDFECQRGDYQDLDFNVRPS